MIEKIILAVAITISLYWSIEIKPQPRVVAIEIGAAVETLCEYQSSVMVIA
jgi:hypothetical protein